MTALLLDVRGRRAVVVGGGPVAARRARSLVDDGARVVVVAPWACEDVRALASDGRLEWVAEEWDDRHLDDVWLVQTATGDAAVDDAVAGAALRRRVWCVHAGAADRGTARTPATAVVDDLVVAVGTAPGTAADPRRAARVRDALVLAADEGRVPLRRGRPGPGSVAVVGGGPGDPGLVTTRARRLLAAADVVVVDRLAPTTVLANLSDDVLVVDAGKSAGAHPVPQEEINRQLVEHARAGRRVVRLKGGDPFVLGRGNEEVRACTEAGVAVEVVPGVTSALAVPAAVGIPLTHRGVSRGFTVVSGHDVPWTAPPPGRHTLVVLMGLGRLEEGALSLQAGGWSPDTPVGVVEDGYGPRQRLVRGTLRDVAGRVAAAGVEPPAVVVVGDVVGLAP